MKVRILDVCLTEIDDALSWYREQGPELPDRLLREIRISIDKLAPFPEAFHTLFEPYRRLRLVRFPYSLVFRVESDTIIIVAFLHQQSDPAKWRKLLDKR